MCFRVCVFCACVNASRPTESYSFTPFIACCRTTKEERLESIDSAANMYTFTCVQLVQLLESIGIKSGRSADALRLQNYGVLIDFLFLSPCLLYYNRATHLCRANARSINDLALDHQSARVCERASNVPRGSRGACVYVFPTLPHHVACTRVLKCTLRKTENSIKN